MPSYSLIRNLSLLLIPLLLACTKPKLGDDIPWWKAAGPEVVPNTFLQIDKRSEYLTMKDGTRIATDIYLPQGATAKLPTLFMQTRYYRSLDLRFALFPDRFSSTVDYFVRDGYAVVVIDTRGSGASFGKVDAPWSPAEVEDGAEIVQWIVKQPWSNGNVGAMGISYDGTAAEMLLTTKHPAVKAIAPRFALFDCYSDIAFPGGIHLNWFTRNWGKGNTALDSGNPGGALGFLAGLIIRGVTPVDADRNRSLLKEAYTEHEANHDIFKDMLGIAYREDLTVRGFSFADVCPFGFIREIKDTKVPIYSYSGWFDGAYPNSNIKRFLSIRNPGSRLVLGPWDHGGRQNISDFSPGRGVAFPHMDELKRYFDLYLRGVSTGIDKENPVHYFTMGEQKWKSSNTWPPPGGTKINVFMGEANKLNYNPPTASTNEYDRYLVDYTAGTGEGSRWNSLLNNARNRIEYPNRKEEDRKLLVYDSAPLAEPLEVTGNPIADIHITSSDKDGAFYVYLEDVWPDGSVHYVTEGQLRALHRKETRDAPLYEYPGVNRSFSREDAELLTPGAPARLRFELIATSYQFKKGHRIRVAIAGADKDHFAFVPKNPPTIHLLRSARYPSRIELPVYQGKK